MNEAIALSDAQRLQALVGDEPGAAAFPALAEAHRRAGQPERAVAVARAGLERRPDALAGRVALGLALLDLGRSDEARAELERVLNSVPDHPVARAGLAADDAAGDDSDPALRPAPPAGAEALEAPFGEPEIEAAFDEATPESDQMLSADAVAERALRAAELVSDDDLADDDLADEDVFDAGGLDDADLADAEDLPMATHTLAELLERQGHRADADAVRARLAPPSGERERILLTLERWLDNLQRGRA